jgi:hypothetical protein
MSLRPANKFDISFNLKIVNDIEKVKSKEIVNIISLNWQILNENEKMRIKMN